MRLMKDAKEGIVQLLDNGSLLVNTHHDRSEFIALWSILNRI